MVIRQRGVARNHGADCNQRTGGVWRRMPPCPLEHDHAAGREDAPRRRQDCFKVVAVLRRVRRIEQHDVEKLERGLMQQCVEGPSNLRRDNSIDILDLAVAEVLGNESPCPSIVVDEGWSARREMDCMDEMDGMDAMDGAPGDGMRQES